jgi:hypothetical protein
MLTSVLALARVAMTEDKPMGKHDTIQEVLGRLGARVGIFNISEIRMPRIALGRAPTIGSGKSNGNYRAQKLERLEQTPRTYRQDTIYPQAESVSTARTATFHSLIPVFHLSS